MKPGLARLCLGLITLATLCALPSTKVLAADGDDDYAFSEKFMFRLSYYDIYGADTSFTVLNDKGIGVGYSMSRDFDTDDSVTVPRVDMHYRFNEHHRIAFTAYSMDRDGSKTLELDVEIGDKIFSKDEVLNSDISYDLYRFSYSYSFYHSDTVELGITGGLDIAKYDLKFSNGDGSQREEADATAPLPMFGLQMGYAIDENWSLHYLMETFFIEIDDTYKGTFLNNEISVQYRFFDNFLVGGGLTHVGIDVEVDDGDWKGDLSDSHNGYLVFAGFYF